MKWLLIVKIDLLEIGFDFWFDKFEIEKLKMTLIKIEIVFENSFWLWNFEREIKNWFVAFWFWKWLGNGHCFY